MLKLMKDMKYSCFYYRWDLYWIPVIHFTGNLKTNSSLLFFTRLRKERMLYQYLLKVYCLWRPHWLVSLRYVLNSTFNLFYCVHFFEVALHSKWCYPHKVTTNYDVWIFLDRSKTASWGWYQKRTCTSNFICSSQWIDI